MTKETLPAVIPELNQEVDLYDQLAMLVAEGKTMQEAAANLGLSTYAITMRLMGDREYEAKVRRARRIRALYMSDETINIADNPTLSDNEAYRKITVRKWVSEKDEAEGKAFAPTQDDGNVIQHLHNVINSLSAIRDSKSQIAGEVKKNDNREEK